jgi:hypothetical protein
MFWFTFGFFGLLCVPLIIMFLVCGADRKHKLGGAIAVIIFWVAFSGGLWLDGKGKADKWNNGYCECGTHWELRGATKSRNGVETKYYVCENCYKEIQI